MVIGDKDNASQPTAVTQNAPLPASIDNIMSGISNTGSVKMNNHRKKLRQRFDIIKKLGQGTYGKVQLGINKETSQEVAIKTIKKCKIETEADLVRIRREVQIMSSVQHPNIIHIYEVFENREKMVLVMEFAAGGELYDYLSERKVLTEEEARRIFRQIATAVYYCHKHKICHRDLKLENILLDENGNAKIADFGLSNVFDDKRLLATFCGSPLYASPEIVKGTPYQGPEVDCWSLGVLLYTLVYGAMPFDGSNFKRLVKQISAGDYYEPKKPSNASPLIREMLTVCPKRRASIEQICNHWWVNESYNAGCLDLAEELANQTPVRLDVLLSLTPSAITSDQLVVPNSNDADNKQNVARSMSVGSIQNISDIANTEAERRIIDMVTAGGEAALAPSPTRTITPSPSAALQVKRKPETTISTESMTGARKRDKPTEQIRNTQSKLSISEVMDVEENEPVNAEQIEKQKIAELSSSTLPEVLNDEKPKEKHSKLKNKGRTDTVIEELPETTLKRTMTDDEPKAAKNFSKTKTTDLSEVLSNQTQATTDDNNASKQSNERRKSRILEVAERFETANNVVEKPKKVILPGVIKKEVARKTSLPAALPSDKPKQEVPKAEARSSDKAINEISNVKEEMGSANSSSRDVDLSKSDSKNSNFSLEEARRSMENSIALLNQAKMESNNELDQLCAKTENVAVSNEHEDSERQKKLKNAREIIGNAIPRMGVRKPPVPFGANGRSISGSVVPSSTNRNMSTPPDPKQFERESPLSIYNSKQAAVAMQPEPIDEEQPTKVSTAEITLKSATLPRRKIETQFSSPYNAVYQPTGNRATGPEPQHKPKEHYIPIQRVGYVANTSSSQRNVLSRQSTNDSDTSDTQTTSTTTMGTQGTLQTSNSSQPIKKSPREFIIPIAVEGGGFITPRAGSLEPSDSNHSTSTAFSRFGGRTRKLSSLFNDSEDESTSSPFHRMQRHTSIGRDSDTEADPTSRFTYRLRSTRPVKKSQSNEGNDSASSGEEDDEDGFEILTAENLFSTLLSRVRALTNRLNVKDGPTSDFPSTRFMSNLRQAHSPFWHHDPFTSRLNSSGAWRHSMTRDLGTDIDSVFSGATLPRGAKSRPNSEHTNNTAAQSNENSKNNTNKIQSNNTTTPNATASTTTTQDNHNNITDNDAIEPITETLDLADLDLSRLRLTKKDLETLSSITPTLPKHFQDQLLAQLPPNQARKLSRTLSMQGNEHAPTVYKRSLSSGREMPERTNSLLTPKGVTPAVVDEKSTSEAPGSVTFDRNSILRRSMSRSRDNSGHRRSTSAIRCEFPSRLSYAGDLRSDYTASKPNDSLVGRYRLTDYTAALPPPSIRSDYYSKLPLPSSTVVNSTIAPQKSPSNEALESPVRSRSRGISRFLRPDFYGSSSNVNAEDNNLTRVRRERERETQSVLREIRERSRDRAQTELIRNTENSAKTNAGEEHRRKSSIPNIRITVDKQNGRIYHARNKSVERCCDIDDAADDLDGNDSLKRQPSIAAPRHSNRMSATNREVTALNQEPITITDQILNEMIRESQEYSKKAEKKVSDGENVIVKKTKSKDGKKSKSKQKSNEHLVQSGEKLNNPKMVTELTNEIQSVTLPLPKSSKIARPVSYMQKDDSDDKSEKKNDRKTTQNDVSQALGAEVSVDVIFRPKIYSNSKLTPPKEVTLKTPKKSPAPSSSAANAKNAITAVMEKLIEKSTERLSPGKSLATVKSKSEVNGEVSPIKTKKKIKVVKKVSKSDQSPTKETSPRKSDDTSNETSPVKERKSPEKKSKSGFLYSIGQKFEKMRENSKKEKEKKSRKSSESIISPIEPEEKVFEQKLKEPEVIQTIIIPRRVKDMQDGTVAPMEEITIRKIEMPPNIANAKPEQRKSRIDAVIRNLRERSVPHTIRAEKPETELCTESALLKRAVSVEDMANGVESFNKSNVNKVLGLFRRIEREQQLQKQQQQQQQQQQQIANNSEVRERPKSGGFVSKLKKTGKPYYTGAKSDTIITLTDQFEKQYLTEKANQTLANCSASVSNSKIPYPKSSSHSRSEKVTNNESRDYKEHSEERRKSHGDEMKRKTPSKSFDSSGNQRTGESNNEISEKERIRNNRKGLVLDLNSEQYNEQFKKLNIDKSNNNTSYHYNTNNHSTGGHCNGANENGMNNNCHNNNYHFYGHSERNNGAHTPSYELSKTYSTDNRSFRDECESTSTFLSPMDEPELCFDDWSACSGSTDDHTQISPHPKHLKYSTGRTQYGQYESNHNQHSCPTSAEPAASTPSDSESVIDRIKRRSFYCRFNEKKPKRTSSIVGPSAQRDYYRDMATKSKPRTSDYLPIVPNGLHTDSESSYSRGGSKSPIPMNSKEQAASRATTPSCYSIIDDNEKPKTPQYHYVHHNRSQTRSPFENNDGTKVKSSDYLNLRSTLTSPPASSTNPKYYTTSTVSPSSLPTIEYQLNGNHRPYSLRNSTYDSISSPLSYGTYNPKRRLSTSYLAPSIAAANSSNGYSPNDHSLSTSCYATFGRTKPKAYDHRTLSLLDTGSISPSSLISKRYGPSTHSSGDSHYTSYYRPVHDYGNFNSRSSLRSPVPQTSTSNV